MMQNGDGGLRIPCPTTNDRRHHRLLQCLILVCLGALIIVGLGVGSLFGPWSQALLGNIVRLTYDERGQRDATVLLFREDNLRQFGTGYPVPYSLHASVLEALATYRPRAVFVDFAFTDARAGDDVEELAQAMCALHGQGIEVKLAVTAPGQPDYGVLPTLLRDGCAQPVDVGLDAPDSSAGLLTYATGTTTASGTFVPTPAFALLPAGSAITPERAEPLEIVWVPGHAPLNATWMNCTPAGFRDSARTLFTEGPLAMRERCPYTRTISVNHLLNSSGDDDLVEALSGRTVLYGADFRMTGDRVPITLFEELPGVFVHAMAYDNLLTFGEDYKRAERGSLVARLADFAFLLLAAALLVYVAPADPSDFSALTRRVDTTIAAGLGIPLIALLTTLTWESGSGLLAGFLAYLLYRSYLDRAFAVLCIVGAAISALAYWGLNLGPRNVLVFIVFFQLLRDLQARLAGLAEQYVRLARTADTSHKGDAPQKQGHWRRTFHDRLLDGARIFASTEKGNAD